MIQNQGSFVNTGPDDQCIWQFIQINIQINNLTKFDQVSIKKWQFDYAPGFPLIWPSDEIFTIHGHVKPIVLDEQSNQVWWRSFNCDHWSVKQLKHIDEGNRDWVLIDPDSSPLIILYNGELKSVLKYQLHVVRVFNFVSL